MQHPRPRLRYDRDGHLGADPDHVNRLINQIPDRLPSFGFRSPHHRRSRPTPLRVEYSPTPLGRTLQVISSRGRSAGGGSARPVDLPMSRAGPAGQRDMRQISTFDWKPTCYQMSTPPPTPSARPAAISIFAKRSKIPSVLRAKNAAAGSPGTTRTNQSRTIRHSLRSVAISSGMTMRSARGLDESARTGRSRTPNERKASEPHTLVRQLGEPAESSTPSGVSSTWPTMSLLPAALGRNVWTIKLTRIHNHTSTRS